MTDSAAGVPSNWPDPAPERVILVGIDTTQNPFVLDRAVEIAHTMSAGLVCVWVDSTQVIFGASIDGTRLITPLDPDQAAEGSEGMRHSVFERAADQLRDAPVPWRLEHTVGDVSSGLAEAAEDWKAYLIVVGGRRPGFSGWMNEVIGGSIAGHLVHTQHTPVVIVPAPPDDAD